MSSLAELIEETKEARELKRALSVKMVLSGITVAQVGELLHVTPQYVRKWKGRYETEGVDALRLGYRGSESYLSVEQRQEIEEWIGAHETVTVEEVLAGVFFHQAHYNRITLLEILNIFRRGERQDPPHLGLQSEYPMLMIDLDNGRHYGAPRVGVGGGDFYILLAGT